MSDEEKPVEYYISEEIAKELESIRFRIDENYELTKERAKMNYERLNESLVELKNAVDHILMEFYLIEKLALRQDFEQHKRKGAKKRAHLHKKKAI